MSLNLQFNTNNTLAYRHFFRLSLFFSFKLLVLLCDVYKKHTFLFTVCISFGFSLLTILNKKQKIRHHCLKKQNKKINYYNNSNPIKVITTISSCSRYF